MWDFVESPSGGEPTEKKKKWIPLMLRRRRLRGEELGWKGRMAGGERGNRKMRFTGGVVLLANKKILIGKEGN